jgi:hypothetical protein
MESDHDAFASCSCFFDQRISDTFRDLARLLGGAAS